MQSANQLKTHAKVSWAFKTVSQFSSLGYTIIGKTADLTVVQKTIIDTLNKEGKPQTRIAKEAVCSQSAVSKHVNVTFEWKKKVWKKKMHNQPRESRPYENCQAKSIQEFGWTSQGIDWGWGQGIKSHHTQMYQGIWLQLSYSSCYATPEPQTTSEASYLGLGEEELDCCPVVQSPLFRWEQVLCFIWKPRS